MYFFTSYLDRLSSIHYHRHHHSGCMDACGKNFNLNFRHYCFSLVSFHLLYCSSALEQQQQQQKSNKTGFVSTFDSISYCVWSFTILAEQRTVVVVVGLGDFFVIEIDSV